MLAQFELSIRWWCCLKTVGCSVCACLCGFMVEMVCEYGQIGDDRRIWVCNEVLR